MANYSKRNVSYGKIFKLGKRSVMYRYLNKDKSTKTLVDSKTKKLVSRKTRR